MTREKFIQATSGWIPVSVLLLFAMSLVTARACDQVSDNTAHLQPGTQIVESAAVAARRQP